MQAALIASLAATAVAAPLISKRQSPEVNDAIILNYALSLEHLEATFYREALQKFTADDFKAVGLGADFYNNLQEIAFDEKTHVDALTAGLIAASATPAQECTYNFGYTDVQGFLATASLLEGVGVSAYLGAAQFIEKKDYLNVAGAILTVEARHSAYLRDNQTPKPLSPFPAPFDIPQSFNNVFSLAAPLITSCPDGDAGTLGLPFTAYPSISVGPAGAAKSGDVLTFTVAKQVDAAAAYFITFPGGAIPAEISTTDGTTYQVTVPEAAQPGQAYVVFTSDNKGPSDDNTVAGPAVFEILDNAGKFQAEYPDYSYGKDCDKKDDYPSHPKSPEYPSKDAPKYAHEAPKKNEHKDTYAPKKDEHKPAPYPEHKDEHKPAPYPEHKDEHKDTYAPKKDEHKDAYPAPYPAKDEHKPEHKDVDYKPEEPKKDAYKPVHDKEGHEYPLDKDGKPCVYKKDGKTKYSLDKDNKPYDKDEHTGKYYTVDYKGEKEPCVEGYTPY